MDSYLIGVDSHLSFIKQEIKDASDGIREIKRGNFNFLKNALVYVLVGGFIFFLSYCSIVFIGEKRAKIKELAETSAIASIENKAVKKYKNDLLKDFSGGKDLYTLVKEWDSKHPEYWSDPDAVLESDRKRIESLSKWAEKEKK